MQLIGTTIKRQKTYSHIEFVVAGIGFILNLWSQNLIIWGRQSNLQYIILASKRNFEVSVSLLSIYCLVKEQFQSLQYDRFIYCVTLNIQDKLELHGFSSFPLRPYNLCNDKNVKYVLTMKKEIKYFIFVLIFAFFLLLDIFKLRLSLF